ncbi:MAG: hypothetical protein Q8P44_05860 [Dehalococcoidia bacterium]|nr:hypothetical protein [Dehalococcoidia bacterium]
MPDGRVGLVDNPTSHEGVYSPDCDVKLNSVFPDLGWDSKPVVKEGFNIGFHSLLDIPYYSVLVAK